MAELLEQTKKRNPSNIFQVQIRFYQRFFNINRSDKYEINHLLEEIEEAINNIQSTFPKIKEYSIRTSDIIDFTADFFEGARYPMRRKVNIKQNLTLSLILYRSALPIFNLAWKTNDWEVYFQRLLYDKLRYTFHNYYTRIKENLNLAICEIILDNQYYELSNKERTFIFDYKKSISDDTTVVWDVYVIIRSTRHEGLNLVYLLIEYLKLFATNEEVRLREIKTGSIKAKIKAYFEDGHAEENAKEGLDELKKYAKGKLSKEFEESEKIKVEKSLLKSEAQLKELEVKNYDQENLLKKRKLEIESLELENERKRLENENIKLKNFRDKVEVLKDLLANSIISQEEFEVWIEGELYLKKSVSELK